MHSPHQVSFALSLVTEGMSDREVAACTGIPRRTIYDWRAGRVPIRLRTPCDVCGGRPERLPGPAYAYLLGLYLGDGCISAAGRTYRLRIACDAGYPGLVDACVAALETLMPRKSAWAGRRPSSRCIDVSMYSNHWPCLLPQHGPGRKHHRPIALGARGDHCAAAASLRSGSHAQRRMPGGRERPWSRERSVSLLEQIGRHSNAPLSEPGRAGSALDAAVLEGGRHLPEGLRCHLGLVRRAQVMTPARR